MTGFSIAKVPFHADDIRVWAATDPRHRNWPVVYVMTSTGDVYVGESQAVDKRMRQHLDTESKQHLSEVRVVLDERFNRSACLDLESFLIRMFSGDGRLTVLNSNAGITDADYYNRASYQRTFDAVFEELRTKEHLFQRSLPEIINSDLFKLSPFKALNHDQAIAVEDILEGLFSDLNTGENSTVVVQGNPGTGKTVVAIYLLKLLQDIRTHDTDAPWEADSIFSDFFTPDNAALLANMRVGIVVPQQSLRESISRVFHLTPGLSKTQVLTPFQVGESSELFDLLIVDEAHRLSRRANQSSAMLNKKFAEITTRLFGWDDRTKTQLDWIRQQSRHTILMLDPGQSVRPADRPDSTTSALVAEARRHGRHYPLASQMRVSAGSDYVAYIRAVLSDHPPVTPTSFGEYDLRFFDDLGEMRRALAQREKEHGLARLVAGYAWPWRSKKDRTAVDIEIDGECIRWNSTQRDWITSPDAASEAGSIHTVQGYDLNYAGVIIGPDLRYDTEAGRIVFDRASYFDRKGKEGGGKHGRQYSDDDLLAYVRNIYTVLLTRGIHGTYIYVCDPALRARLRGYF